MAIDPSEVVAGGGGYRADSGEDRLVWIVRDGRVSYFHRDDRQGHRLCTHPPDPYPPVASFAAEVSLVHLDASDAIAAANDAYGAGDW